jgi:hypothetical protein
LNPRNKEAGFNYLSLLIALAILAGGATAIVLAKRSQIAQEQANAGTAQRATYATVQQEVTLQGIDPTKIVNPLAAIGSPIGTSFGSESTASNSIGVTTAVSSSTLGGGTLNFIQTQSNGETGDRGGGVGVYITDTGNPVVYTPGVNTTALLPPTVSVATPLSTASFPATSWFTLPANPPGTSYRYTVDGSTPTASSPIWTAAVAAAINDVNFPAQINIGAFNADPRYASSTVTTLGSIQMALPGVVYSRNDLSTSTVFTYAQMTSVPVDGIILGPSGILTGVTYSIKYTCDGTDPRSSGTAVVYAGDFVVPFANWTGSGGTTATLMVSLTSSDPRYLASVPSTFTLSISSTALPAPTFSISSAGGPVPVGTIITFTETNAVATVYNARWVTPTIVSPSGTSTTLP